MFSTSEVQLFLENTTPFSSAYRVNISICADSVYCRDFLSKYHGGFALLGFGILMLQEWNEPFYFFVHRSSWNRNGKRFAPCLSPGNVFVRENRISSWSRRFVINWQETENGMFLFLTESQNTLRILERPKTLKQRPNDLEWNTSPHCLGKQPWKSWKFSWKS